MGDHGALLGKAGHVFRFPAEEALGDEQREIGVLHAGFLEHAVQDVLHLLPDGIAVGFDDHAAANGGLLCQIGLDYQVVIPLGIIVGAFGYLFCHDSYLLFFVFVRNIVC